MTASDLPLLLVALQQALDALEVEAGWQPDDLLARVLVRRRHSVRLLRRAISASDRPVGRPMAVAGPGDLAQMLAAEERMAKLVDAWLERLPSGHPHRTLADHLRAETDDAARALRAILVKRCD